MKRAFLLLASYLMTMGALYAQGQGSDFVKGADVGFLAGQERRGIVFHDSKGAPTAIMEAFVTE